MPVPENLNPFAGQNVYEKYGLEPRATVKEITDRLRSLGKELDSLDADTRAERIADIQQDLNKIKNHRLRVLLNAVILDPLDRHKMLDILESMPGPKEEDITLPALGLSQVMMEGECPDYSQEDFQQVPPQNELELDLEKVKDHFDKRPIERHIVFDE